MNTNQVINYYKIENYVAKVRITPNKEQREFFESIMRNVGIASNIILGEIQNHNPLVAKEVEKDGEIVWWPDFSKLSDSKVRELLGDRVVIPKGYGEAFTNVHNGLVKDLKKKWESQKKLLIDKWFVAEKKGHRILKFYGRYNPRTSFWRRASCKSLFSVEEGENGKKRYYTHLNKTSKIRIRNWPEYLRFGENHDQDFFDYCKDEVISYTITHNNCDEWYMCILISNAWKPVKESVERHPVGFDLNLKTDSGIVDSDGVRYENKQFYRNAKEKLAFYEKTLSTMQGPKNITWRNSKDNNKVTSNRYLKTLEKISKLQKKVARQREWTQHQYSNAIVSKANIILAESLNVSDMLKNNNISLSVSDASFYSQLLKIKYKADWCGIPVQQLGQFEASTQVCSCCGYQLSGDEKLTLSDREWVCPECGTHLDRDYNAALVILKKGLEYYNDDIHDLEGKDITKKEEKKKTKSLPADRVIDKNRPDIVGHYNPDYRNPWIVVDNRTNTIINDAQGFGFDTFQKLQKCMKHFWKQQIVTN